MDDLTVECSEEELGKQLKSWFDQGYEEVVVQHPFDGEIVVTRETFEEYLREIDRWKQMSPAERLVEKKKVDMRAHFKRKRLADALIKANFATVDMDSDETQFGYDINGEKLDIEGMTTLPTMMYPAGVIPLENEAMAFIDEREIKDPIRILTNTPAGGGANNASN